MLKSKMTDCDELSLALLLNSLLLVVKEEKNSVIPEKSAESPRTDEKIENVRKYVPVDDSLVNYGAIAKNLPGHVKEKYFLTTAISYTNGFPHIGHAYEVSLIIF